MSRMSDYFINSGPERAESAEHDALYMATVNSALAEALVEGRDMLKELIEQESIHRFDMPAARDCLKRLDAALKVAAHNPSPKAQP